MVLEAVGGLEPEVALVAPEATLPGTEDPVAAAVDGGGTVWTIAAQDVGFAGTTTVSFGFSGTEGAGGATKGVGTLFSSVGTSSTGAEVAVSDRFGDRLLDFRVFFGEVALKGEPDSRSVGVAVA